MQILNLIQPNDIVVFTIFPVYPMAYANLKTSAHMLTANDIEEKFTIICTTFCQKHRANSSCSEIKLQHRNKIETNV